MKNALKKIFLVAQSFLCLIFVVLLILIMTNTLGDGDFTNGLSYILLSILFGLSVASSLFLLYANFSSGALGTVLVHSDGVHETKMPSSELRRIIKNELSEMEGMTIKHSSFFLSENGLTLLCRVKVQDRLLEPALKAAREILAGIFLKRLGLEFHAIDFKVLKFKYNVTSTESAINSADSDFEKTQPQPSAKTTLQEDISTEPIKEADINPDINFNNPSESVD